MSFWMEVKFKIAMILDRNPDYCWSQLIKWAMGFNPFWSIMMSWRKGSIYKIQICKKDNDATPYPGCLKCLKNGRYYE